MPFLAKSITKIRTIEKTTILSPGVDWISRFKESIFIFNSSKNLSHSLPPITNIALVVFGPGKLPEIGKAVGKSLREFRSASTEDNTKTIDAKNEDEKKDKK